MPLTPDPNDYDTRKPPTEPILQFFRYEHLPTKLQEVSKPFGDLAHDLVRGLPRNPERTVALRKLLESKDAAVRAMLFTPDTAPSLPAQNGG
jgi:hypothetical protein